MAWENTADVKALIGAHLNNANGLDEAAVSHPPLRTWFGELNPIGQENAGFLCSAAVCFKHILGSLHTRRVPYSD